MINGQFIKLGPRHAGKIATVVIEDTHYRVLRGEDELAVRPCKNLGPITGLYVKGMGTQMLRQELRRRSRALSPLVRVRAGHHGADPDRGCGRTGRVAAAHHQLPGWTVKPDRGLAADRPSTAALAAFARRRGSPASTVRG
ncbi:hypothetical protein [Streptomyces sp. NPDC093260]|uniref:hypothetical protein n=1 Tax=Streptomyces sp. NPDC093260 TaxID=3155073 RepID=UPI003448E875